MRALAESCPTLNKFIIPAAISKGGRDTIDFANPAAVYLLNKAILAKDYGVQWDIPAGKLCPPGNEYLDNFNKEMFYAIFAFHLQFPVELTIFTTSLMHWGSYQAANILRWVLPCVVLISAQEHLLFTL
jgi:hypothetical protein